MIATSDDFVQFQIIHLVSWEQRHEFWAEIHLSPWKCSLDVFCGRSWQIVLWSKQKMQKKMVRRHDQVTSKSMQAFRRALLLLCHKSVMRYMLLISLNPRQWTETSWKLHQWTSVPHGWRCRRNALRPKPEMEMFHHRAAWHIWVDSYRSKAPCRWYIYIICLFYLFNI